jgi:ATP-dependent DNA helicase RecG
LHELVTKIEGRPEAVRVWNYPYRAFEELLANCMYHRNYQEREPVTIRIEQDAIYLYNIGGPDRSIKMEDFKKGRVFPKRYRNRRLGDFLKELDLTEDDGMIAQLGSLVSTLVSNLVSSDPIYKDFAKILLFLGDGSRKREDILKHIGLSNQTYNYRNYIEPLEKAGLVQKSNPSKPQSPRQQYLLTAEGESLILTFIGA